MQVVPGRHWGRWWVVAPRHAIMDICVPDSLGVHGKVILCGLERMAKND